MSSLRVEGIDLYYYDGEVRPVGCVVEMEDTGETVASRDRNCIGSLYDEREPGRISLGSLTMTVRADPTRVAYSYFYDAFTGRNYVDLCIGHSDGVMAPDYDTEWRRVDRSITTFRGFVSSMPSQYEDNTSLKLTINIEKTEPTVNKWIRFPQIARGGMWSDFKNDIYAINVP